MPHDPRSPADGPVTRSRRADLAVLLTVLLLAGWWLSPLLEGGFLTDDFHALNKVGSAVETEAGWTFDNVRELAAFYARPADPNFQLYRPSVLASFGATCLSAGAAPRPYMLTNWLAHLVCGILVFCLSRRVAPAAPAAAIGLGTAVFLLSPLQIEVVAWSAARSEWLSLVFGMAALLWRWRRPDSLVLPLLFVALAMTAKETSVTFVGLMAWLELVPLESPGQSADDKRRSRSAMLRRLAVWVAFGCAYLILRKVLFGSFTDVKYNRQEVGGFFADPWLLMTRYAQSFGRMIAPLAEVVVADPAIRRPFVALSAIAFLLAGFMGMRVVVRRPRPAFVLLILLVVPFAISIPVNEITPNLVNSRAVYCCMAALSALFCAGTTASGPRWLRFGPMIVMVAIGLAVSRPTQALWLRAHHEIDASLQSIRTATNGLDVTTIGLLGYPHPEPVYFEGGFTMAGGIRPALSRPFMARDHWIEKVASDAAPSAEYRSFPEVFNGDTRQTALLLAKPLDADGFRRYELVSRGRWSGRDGFSVVPVEPPTGATVRFDLNRPQSLTLAFVIDVVGTPVSLRCDLLRSNHAIPTTAFAIADLPFEQRADGARRFTLHFDIPAGVAAALSGSTPVAWVVSALDAGGAPVAQAEARLLYAQREP